jgi:ubiquinone/menaquinone biosynthesis C-methylase UbiE
MRRLWQGLLALAFRLLNLAFHLLYNQLAWAYDFVAWVVSLGQWRAWARASLEHLSGQRVLELGHGPGHLLAEMYERGLAPIGVDLSVSMGRLAKKRLAARGAAAPLVRARAQHLPFENRAFGSVVATFPAEFIADPAALKECHRVLDDRGRLVSITVARPAGTGVPACLLRALYKATGQSRPLGRTEPCLKSTSFKVSSAWLPVGRAEVLLLLAQKQGTGL